MMIQSVNKFFSLPILLFLLFVLPRHAAGVEIATGKMLGGSYKERSFYTRERGGEWRETYSDDNFRPEARGRMMNLRIAQGLFHDEWMTEVPFDPVKNTERLIDALDSYREHGILAVSVSMQGGNPAFQRFPQISRDLSFKMGPGKGALVSAFRPDGSLKESWTNRLLRLVRELDRRGMILDLIYFYQRQDELFENTEAIDQATMNATDWLIENDCRNVFIEIANEHDVKSYDHDRYIHEKMGHLIQVARERFAVKNAAFRLPISASTGGGMRVYDGVREHGDLTIIHGNNRSVEEKRKRVTELAANPMMPGPIYMNEDNNGRETTQESLAKELGSFDSVYQSGGSWGYMPWVQLQIFPFRYFKPSGAASVSDDMPVPERDPAYFHVVLEHIRKAIMTEDAAAANCSLISERDRPAGSGSQRAR